MELTPYQHSLELIALGAIDQLTIAEISAKLAELGWTAEALEEPTIRFGLSEMGMSSLIREVSTGSTQRT